MRGFTGETPWEGPYGKGAEGEQTQGTGNPGTPSSGTERQEPKGRIEESGQKARGKEKAPRRPY